MVRTIEIVRRTRIQRPGGWFGLAALSHG